MAVYKVPQDVEADDKLLGPFSFKQFIFLLIMVMMLGLAYMLSQIFLPLAIIPLPIALFFAALALPLRKDQPMEVYLAAVISFIVKPKRRLWYSDGIETMVEVVAPKVEERQYGKGYDQAEVQRRLSYLANLVDSRGWSVRGVNSPNSSMQVEIYNEAQNVNDMLDDNNSTSRQIDSLINKADMKRRQEMIEKMKHGSSAGTPQPQPAVADNRQASAPKKSSQPATTEEPEPKLQIDPYPTMRQAVLQPISDIRPGNQKSIRQQAVSPAIMDLARNHSDRSVESLQREAKRIKKEEDEIVIPLR